MCGSQTLKQEAVTLKLPWKPQDVKDGLSAKKSCFLVVESARKKKVCCSHQRWKWSGDLKDHFDIWQCRVGRLPRWFPILLWGLQLSDCMNLRIDVELWTFNIVETAIDYRDLGSGTKCILHYAMFRYGPHMFEQAYDSTDSRICSLFLPLRWEWCFCMNLLGIHPSPVSQLLGWEIVKPGSRFPALWELN